MMRQEHLLVSKIFQVTLEKNQTNKVYVEDLVNETEFSCSEIHLDSILLACMNVTPPEERVSRLHEYFQVYTDLVNNSKPVIDNPELREKLHFFIPSFVMNYVVLVSSAHEMFRNPENFTIESWPDWLSEKLMKKDSTPQLRVSVTFLLRLAETLSTAEGDEAVSQVYQPILETFLSCLKGRTESDLRFLAPSIVASFLRHPKNPIARVMLNITSFFSHGTPRQLQETSFLGWLVSANPIDEPMTAVIQPGTEAAKQHSPRLRYFMNLSLKSRSSVSASQSLIQQTTKQVVEQTLQFVNPLLRVNAETRDRIVEWFITCVEGCSARTKINYQLPSASHIVDVFEQTDSAQNLSFQIMQRNLLEHYSGLLSSGVAFNVFFCLLHLCRPMKRSYFMADPFFFVHDELRREEEFVKRPQKRRLPSRNSIQHENFDKEAKLGDSELVEQIVTQHEPKESSFKTKMFYCTARGLHILFIPFLKEAETFLHVMSHLYHNGKKEESEEAWSYWLLYQAQLQSTEFLEVLGHFLNLEMRHLLQTIFLVDSFADCRVPAKHVTDEFACQPAFLIEDILEVMSTTCSIQISDKRLSDLFSCFLDSELVVQFLVVLLGSDEHFRNPSVRGKAASLLYQLSQEPAYFSQVSSSFAIENLIPSCIRVFTAVEKTQRSYYDIRMQIKFELRIPILELFESLLPTEGHRQSLKRFAEVYRNNYLKFMNQLMNDTTYLLDEGLDNISDYRKKVEGGNASERPEEDEEAPPRLELRREFTDEVDEETDFQDGQDIYRRSRHDPLKQCQTYMKMGHRTIRALYHMCSRCPEVLVQDRVVLTQLVQFCLNACLNRLVGPKCLELKSRTNKKDFEKFNFYPKQLLAYLCEMYVLLFRCEPKQVIQICLEDGRHYKPETFRKAVIVVCREGIMNDEISHDFARFVKLLNEQANDEAANDIEIPEEYLDPVMADLMLDPVRLPTSGMVMDRLHITRIVMTSDEDPFNRKPLKLEDLQPCDELRQEIRDWLERTKYSVNEDR